MGTRPQTLFALADSPLGLATWMLDHDARSEEQFSQAIVEGHPYGAITRDDILDNITLYWLTNTGVSSGRLYWENKFSFFGVKNISIPVAVSVFPGERYQAPRSWAEKAYQRAHLLQRARHGGPLRRLGAAGTLLRRGSRRLPVPSLDAGTGARRN